MDIIYPSVPQNQGIQTPPNSGPTYGLANSIDALFDSYQRAKVQNALLPGQVQGQNLQNQGAQQQLDAGTVQTLLRNGGYSDAQIAQALQGQQGQPTPPPSYTAPAQPQDGGPASMYAQPQTVGIVSPQPGSPMQPGQAMPFGPQMAPGTPQNAPGQPQPQNQAKAMGTGPFGHQSAQDAANSLMQFTQAGRVLGAQEAIANLSKTQAEAAKTGAEAQLSEAQIQALGGSDSLTSNLVQQIQSGKMKLDDLSNLGRGELANALRVGVNAKLAASGTNTNALSNANAAQAAGLKSSADLTQGGSAQEMARSANSAYKQFDLLQQASDNFGRANNQLLNKPLNEIKATNSPEAQVFKTALSTARIEYARAASGSKSPSDTFMQEAQKALPDGITASQITPVLNQLRNSLSEQTRGQLSPATLQSAPPIIPGQSANTGSVNIKMPDGKVWAVPAAQAQKAISRGGVQQ